MKTIKTPLLAAILLSLLNLGCENQPIEAESDGSEPVSAIVVDGGNQATDGCGWLIRIDSYLYSPTNLASELQQDGLRVVVEFTLLNERLKCGFPYEPRYARIQLETIRRD